MPILDRIDAIETADDDFGQTSDVTPEDLIPNDLSYRMVPGDFVTLQIYELYERRQWAAVTRRVGPGGFVRAPELGDVQAAGLTPQEFEEALSELYVNYVTQPQVEVVLEEGTGFTYTIYGRVPGPGIYTLRDPDLRLMDALAVSGGVPEGVDRVFVIRQVELSERVKPSFDRSRPSTARPDVDPDDASSNGSVDIDDLIDRLDDRENRGGFSPGVLRQDGEPAIDIEDLEPVTGTGRSAVDIDSADGGRRGDPGSWVYIEERGEWVRVPSDGASAGTVPMPGEPPLYVERVIEIPAKELMQGLSRYNIVVRPDDRIFVEPPSNGVVYINGEVVRPGPYNIPVTGQFTLARAITTAGGLNQLAIPERVDLVRIVGDGREAVVTVNLAAIMHKTEPDILLKPDDHIIVGTNFWAAPLAVIRNGFRMTYGFGFLLDRNFGNDVFGAPPSNVGRN